MPHHKRRILCVLSTILGNVRMTERLIEALGRIDDVEPLPVVILPEDYAKYRASRWMRVTNPWESQHVAWEKSGPWRSQPFDVLLVNSWENVVGFRAVARRVPAIALLDVVPATVDLQNRARGETGWKRRLSNAVHSTAFRRAVREFDYLLPMGSDCADSLRAEYGCDPGRLAITLAPQDLDVWVSAPRSYSAPLRLLFVGNDFERKGGEFLLQLYSAHLASRCSLTIVSNDPALAGRNWPAGVTHLRGQNRDQMVEVLRRSDLFLFPSLQDFMPQAVCEALSSGVPCIANDVGAIRDVVRTGETGFLMARFDPPESWASRILDLAGNPAELARLSAGARAFAEQNLSHTRFESLIADVIERVCPVAGQ